MNYISELQATETRLGSIIDRLKNLVSGDYSVTPVHTGSGVSQLPLPLFQTSEYTISLEVPKIVIPENINEPFGRSEQAPLIYWALVMLKKMGHGTASGVEITEIINNHLVDAHHKKAPNNISSALRSHLLQSQPWLVTTVISPLKKVFSLADNWPDYWTQFFGEPAPGV